MLPVVQWVVVLETKVTCRFHGALNDFLPPFRRNRTFDSRFKGRESVKDKIEALGVPHPEVDVILVNGGSVGFDYLLGDGDHIGVYPGSEAPAVEDLKHLKHPPEGRPRFIADTNIHDVVKTMRALGLDVFEDVNLSSRELIDRSINTGRILMTSSRELLKRKEIRHGIFVRRGNPDAQIQRIVTDYSLKSLCRPFSRCLVCNTLLVPVAKEQIKERIPPKVRARFAQFARCSSCDRLYWKGTHYEKIKTKVDRILSPVPIE